MLVSVIMLNMDPLIGDRPSAIATILNYSAADCSVYIVWCPYPMSVMVSQINEKPPVCSTAYSDQQQLN